MDCGNINLRRKSFKSERNMRLEMNLNKAKEKDLIELYNQISAFIKFLEKEEKDSEKMMRDSDK